LEARVRLHLSRKDAKEQRRKESAEIKSDKDNASSESNAHIFVAHLCVFAPFDVMKQAPPAKSGYTQGVWFVIANGGAQ
jgi:hypothetical protein